MKQVKRGIFITIGALALSVLGLQASDTLRGLDTQLTGMVADSGGPCGEGAVQILLGSHALCVDVYEASASEECPHASPTGQNQTQENLNDSDCQAVSQPEVIPWRFISLTQAQQLCARSGKRLPTNDEWFKVASGISDQSGCVVNNDGFPSQAGSGSCVTPAGVHDIVGNVWEWIDGEVVNGLYESRQLPLSGYVSLVDSDGVVVETSPAPPDDFGKDYAWTKDSGVFGIIRGGYYGSESDAGIFAQNLSVPLDFKVAGIGFRCVRDI